MGRHFRSGLAAMWPRASPRPTLFVRERGPRSWITHGVLYSVAVAEADNTPMQRGINWFKGNPMESWVVMNQADNAMALGHLRRSRELFDHARMLALKQDLKEFADEITEARPGLRPT